MTRSVGITQPRCPLPAHLHLLPDVLPVGEEVVERVLGILHVAAVLAINQQPVEGGKHRFNQKHLLAVITCYKRYMYLYTTKGQGKQLFSHITA